MTRQGSRGDATGWIPLLGDDPRRRAIEAAIEEILALLASRDFTHPTLTGGSAGAALLFDYAQGMACEASRLRRSEELQAASIERMSGLEPSWSLYGGHPGVGWAIEQLASRTSSSGPSDDLCEDLDEFLLELLRTDPWPFHFDLISGLVGVGVYGNDRRSRPAGHSIVDAVLDRLAGLARREGRGVAWYSPRSILPAEHHEFACAGYFDLGIAHGNAGVISWLGEVLKRRPGLDRAEEFLAGGVGWLLDHRLPPGSGSSFATRIGDGIEPRPSRVAWCYGDLGVVVGLLNAACASRDPFWRDEATRMGLAVCEREMSTSGIEDPGLCHGAAGVAHLFNRLFQATGLATFRNAALRSFDLLLAMRRPGEGLAGFTTVRGGGEGQPSERVADESLLTGVTGIALAMQAAVSTVEPAWDGLLLASLPVGALRTSSGP